MHLRSYKKLGNSNSKEIPINGKCNLNSQIKLLMVTLFLICLLVGSIFIDKKFRRPSNVRDDTIYDCDIQLVESIPIGLNYKNSTIFMSTFDAWQLLIDKSTKQLDIGSFYWTLRGKDTGVNDTSSRPGEKIFQRLLSNGNAKSKIMIRIAQSQPSKISPDWETKLLAEAGAAEVVSVDFAKYLGGGVLHTKLWIADGKHFYIGSANNDWRSLTQVKELGILAQDCPQLASDLSKIFNAYWYLGSNKNVPIPDIWPHEYDTVYNVQQPMNLNVDKNSIMQAYLSSSPPPLSANGRTHDLDAILETINTAKKFVYIAVMDYYPLIIYGKQVKYWPFIDNALRKAAVERRVVVRMLISLWPHSDPSEVNYLRSLEDLSMLQKHIDIQIRRFVVPQNASQAKIPYARVNHNKYMVTDSVAYIGTSNWSGDYFTDTAGVALVLKDTQYSNSLRSDLKYVFERDWNSQYSQKL